MGGGIIINNLTQFQEILNPRRPLLDPSVEGGRA